MTWLMDVECRMNGQMEVGGGRGGANDEKLDSYIMQARQI